MDNLKSLAGVIIISIVTLTYSSCTNNKTPEATAANQGVAVNSDTSRLVGMWLDEDIKTDIGEQVAYQRALKHTSR